jgi:hypothetical protein
VRSRLFGVIVVVLGLLLSTLSGLTAVADPPDPDRDVPPNRMYENPAEQVIWDKRVRDKRASADPRAAMRDAAVNYAVTWWRANHLSEQQKRTIRNLISLQKSRQRTNPEKYPPPPIELTLFEAKELRRSNPALYEFLIARGMDPNDTVVQKVGRSIPISKGQRPIHAEEGQVRLAYILEYYEQELRKGRSEAEILASIDKELLPGKGVELRPKDLFYGVTEREPCNYPGGPACTRWSGVLDYMVPYGSEKQERKASKGKVARNLQETMQAELAEIITTTWVRDEVTKALRPFRQPGELPGRRYDYEPGDPRADPPGLERVLDPAKQDMGGIDFSTMELRYMAEDGSSGTKNGVRYAFTGKTGGSKDSQSVLAGAQSVNTASDAFFVWLALPESSFWVNLNPNEPDRIVDQQLGRTEAGRIMLEADLRLKKTVGKVMDPRTKLGKRFWDSMRSYNGERCFSGRYWITPKPAKIYDKNGELYIIDAPLDVKTEQEYIQDTGNGKYEGCPYQPQSVDDHNSELVSRLIMPKVREVVNTAPEYGALRQIYLSRIAAEWYRERSKTRPMELTSLIDSGDVTRWPVAKTWAPKDTYRRYLESYTHGEVNTSAFSYGGVILTDVPKQRVTETEFNRSWPDARSTVRKAQRGVSAGTENGQLWFGGTSSEPKQRPKPVAQPDNGGGWPPFAQVLLLVLAAVALPLGFLLWRRTTSARTPSSR